MDTLSVALLCLRAGISVIPIRRDGSKAPDGALLPHVWDEVACRGSATWKPFQTKHPSLEQAQQWWGGAHPPGIAAVCGAVSGGLELIDFDRQAEELFPAWHDLVEEERPGLVDRLSLVQTPRQPAGYHVWLRCPDCALPGNSKLALDPQAPGKDRCLIETRGEGGYALIPGCPADCHTTGHLYTHLSGPPLWQLPPLSIEERRTLWRCARTLSREAKEDGSATLPPGSTGLRPGDDFDVRGPDWSTHGQERRWRRPGKEHGWSATTGYCRARDGADLLRVFSSNAAPFEDGKAYGKFRALMLLQFAGDPVATARAIARLGFGTPSPTRPLSRTKTEPTTADVEFILSALARADPARLRQILAPLFAQEIERA
jgi:hypothetical protein